MAEAVTAVAPSPMARPRAMSHLGSHAPRPHILVVNGRKVRQPVFVIGAPHSGADLLARALKRSDGFHLTIGQRSVVQRGATRSPGARRSSAAGAEAAATVLRDAFAQAWQVTAALLPGLLARSAGRPGGWTAWARA